jgi:hypothetical protein
MAGIRASELDVFRERLTAEERAILNTTWEHFRDRNEWIPCTTLHHRFGKAGVQACLGQLGATVITRMEDDGEEYYRLTFFGVLLTDQGEEAELLLARYLEYIRNRCREDPRLEWVGSQDVEGALNLTAGRSRLLRQLIRVSHWWGGGSGFGDQEWTVGVPIDVDEIPTGLDLREYVREHVLAHFQPGPPPPQPGKPRGEFWFVTDPDLRGELSRDWREAQDVYRVQGWKSCVLLCGRILEAILLDALSREADAGRVGLADLLEAAIARGILRTGVPYLGPALREFRGLIAPGRPKAERIEVTRDEAEAALIAVRMCLRQLGAETPKI